MCLFNSSKIPDKAIVALRGETVFGLAVKLNDQTAINKLMRLKDRPFDSDKQFVIALDSKDEIGKYALISPKAKKIIDKYLPGPLTLVLPKNPDFAHPYFDHFSTIGVRVPIFKPLNKVLRRNGPILLTSANLRGAPPARSTKELRQNTTLSQHITKIFPGRIGNNPPTTILKIDEKDHLSILRQGALKILEAK